MINHNPNQTAQEQWLEHYEMRAADEKINRMQAQLNMAALKQRFATARLRNNR